MSLQTDLNPILSIEVGRPPPDNSTIVKNRSLHVRIDSNDSSGRSVSASYVGMIDVDCSPQQIASRK